MFSPSPSSTSSGLPQQFSKGLVAAKDIVLCLMFLLSLFNIVHSAFRDRVGWPWVATPKYAPETRDGAQKRSAGAGGTAQQHHLQTEGKVNSTAVESTDIQLFRLQPSHKDSHSQQQSPLYKGESIKPNQVCLVNNDEVLW